MPKKQATFESKLEELEALVRKMEEGGLSLDETLASYEAGAKLAEALSGELEGAKQRLLVLSGGKLTPAEEAP